MGTPGSEHLFDDANIARLLRGEQLIDVIPSRVRREIVDHNIVRLVKGAGGEPSFEPIDSPADVIKLAGPRRAARPDGGVRGRPRCPKALGRDTQLAIGARIDALRDADIHARPALSDDDHGERTPRAMDAADGAA